MVTDKLGKRPAEPYDRERMGTEVTREHPLSQQLAKRHFTLQDDRPSHLAELDLTQVDPSLRTLLFTDGTVTRTLEAQTLSPVSVEVVSQDQTAISPATAEHLAVASGVGTVRRRVQISIGKPASPVIWAESHIVASRLPDEFFDVLGDAPDGIGASLQQVQLESWREMLWFGIDSAPPWRSVSTSQSEMAITRVYRVMAGGAPALLISETFAVRRQSGRYRLDAQPDQADPNSSSIS